MDTAKLGVAIDPTAAAQGAKRVKQELQGIGQQAKTSLGQVDAAANKTGTGMRRMGTNARAGFLDMSRGIMDVLDAAGLLNNGFGSMLRRTDSAIRGGQQMAAMTRGLSAGANAAGGAMNGMAGAAGTATGATGGLIAKMGGLGVLIGGIVAAFIALAAAIIGVGVAMKALSAGIAEAAKMEQMMVRMAVAMGSFSKAKEQFAVLRQFAAETPFSDEEVFRAGTALQAMTKGALTTKAALTAIGGAASQAGMGFEMMAENIGTIYNGLMNGTDVLEYMKTLVSKGIIDGATLAQVRRLGEEAEKSGSKTANAAKQWALIYADLETKGVALVLQSQTWSGLLSTIEGNWQAIKAAFGEETMIALKPMLQDIIALMPKIQALAAQVGSAIGRGIGALYNAVKSGELATLLKLGLMAAIEQAAAFLVVAFQLQVMAVVRLVTSAISGAIQTAVNLAVGLFTGVVNFITRLIEGDFSGAFAMVGNFFKNLFTGGGGIVANIGKSIYNSIGQALTDAVNTFVQAFYRAWAAVDRTIQSGKAAFGVAPSAGLGPVMPKPMTFTPMKVEFADLMKAANGLVGTGARDAFTSKLSDLAPPGQKNPDVELPQPKPSPLENPTGTGTGGSGKDATANAPKAEAVRSQIDDLTKAWQDLGTMMDETMANVAQSISSNMTNSLTDMIMGAKGAKQAFSEMATAIVGDIINMILKMTIQLALARALAAMGYGGAGGGAGIMAGLAHTGGTVGVTNLSQVPKYHQGGQLSSEKMVRVDKGETILTRRQSADLSRELAASRSSRAESGKGQGGNATIINVLDRNEIGDAVARNPGAVINALSRNLPAVRKMVLSGERP